LFIYISTGLLEEQGTSMITGLTVFIPINMPVVKKVRPRQLRKVAEEKNVSLLLHFNL
jgi:hypothetical protein